MQSLKNRIISASSLPRAPQKHQIIGQSMTTNINPSGKTFESPAALRKRLMTRWPGLLRSHLLREDELCPVVVRIGAPKLDSASMASAGSTEWFAAWRKEGETHPVVFKQHSRRGTGQFEAPHCLSFETMPDMASFFGSDCVAELKKAVARLQSLEEISSGLRNMANKHKVWMELTDNEFRGLSEFLRIRQEAPMDMLDIRAVALPGVDGKFLENNKSLVLACLGAMGLFSDGEDWRTQMGFRSDNRQVAWVKFHPDDLKGPLGAQQFALRSDSFENLPESVTSVFIVENQAVFFAYEPRPGVCLMWGGGNAIAGMACHMTALKNVEVVYWGDIDQAGLKILDRLRAVVPHTKSVCMDKTFFDTLPESVVKTDPTGVNIYADYNHLSQDEHILAEYVSALSIRVEQEHLIEHVCKIVEWLTPYKLDC